MRQKDDREFVQLPNRSREGKHSEDNTTILKKRLVAVRPGQDNYPMNMAHLFYYKCIRRYLNTSLYNLSKTDTARVKVVDIIVGDISDDLKKQTKNKIPDDPTKTMGSYSLVSVITATKYD